MLFRSKTAMSPLIATVLLIAFAVALGTMIMNWSSGMAPGEHTPSQSYCKEVSITTTDSICHDGIGLHFSIKNDGKKRMDGLIIRFENVDMDTDLRIKQAVLVPNERLDKIQSTSYPGEETQVTFIPMVMDDGELHECFDGGFAQNKLPIC